MIFHVDCCAAEGKFKKNNLLIPATVMGHVISTGLELVGTTSSPRVDERLASAVTRTLELANSQDITPREKLHVKAVELFSHG